MVEKRLPRILLVVDWPSSSFDQIAAQIRKHVGGYHYSTMYISDAPDGPKYRQSVFEKADLVLFFWWGAFSQWRGDIPERVKKVVAFYDHPSVERFLGPKLVSMTGADHVIVCNENLYETAAAQMMECVEGAMVPLTLCEDGVDTEMFWTPADQAPRREGPLRVGWIGNSKINLGGQRAEFKDFEYPETPEDDPDYKGLALIREAVKRFSPNEVTLDVVDRAAGQYIPRAKLPEWYLAHDAIICASRTEGTPNPMLEALACHRAIITTKVGVVPKLMKYMKNGNKGGHTIYHRDVDGIQRAISQCLERRKIDKTWSYNVWFDTGSAILGNGGWDWEVKAQNFRKVFDAELNWSAEKAEAAPLAVPAYSRPVQAPGRKPRVLLVADVRGWAFDQNEQDMAKYLKADFDFDFWYVSDYQKDGVLPDFGLYDAVFVPYHRWGIDDVLPWDRLLGSLRARWFAPEAPGPATDADVALVNQFRGFHVVTRDNFDDIKDRCPGAVYLTNPIDMTRFPEPGQYDEVVACWSGNARHYNSLHQDVKGFHPIVKPACRKAGVPLVYAEYHTNRLTFEEMPAFYRKANIVLCASLYEGASNSVMEAMASGCAAILTPVGNAVEMHEKQMARFGRSGIVLVERDEDVFVETLLALKDKPGLVKEMGLLNRQSIQDDWSWERWAPGYRDFFRMAMTEVTR